MSKLIIKNVSSHMPTHGIEKLCAQYGLIKKVRRQDGEIHVQMQSAKQARKAYVEIDGMPLLGKPLEVVLQQ